MTDKIIQVRIGKSLIGLRGLPEIFQEVAAQTWESPDATQEELLRRVAGQNYVPSGSRDDYRRALWREFRSFLGEPAAEEAGGGLEIKVLGLGCSGCQRFYQQVVEILAANAVAADLQYITTPALLKDYAVRAFPALVINGELVLAGRIPPLPQLTRLLLAHAGSGPTPESKAGQDAAPGE